MPNRSRWVVGRSRWRVAEGSVKGSPWQHQGRKGGMEGGTNINRGVCGRVRIIQRCVWNGK